MKLADLATPVTAICHIRLAPGEIKENNVLTPGQA
jgi:hypothetical protein